MEEIEKLREEVELIKERNKKVELDKKWERSFARRALLIIFTYLAVALYLQAINIPQPWLNAIVPAVGFLLSTLSMPFFKKLWLEKSEGGTKVMQRQTREKIEHKAKILESFGMAQDGNVRISNDDVQEMVGVSDATAERYLDELEKEGKIKQVGGEQKNTYYSKL